jgi:tRNA(Arg) A34 adenosine deaminase TadA
MIRHVETVALDARTRTAHETDVPRPSERELMQRALAAATAGLARQGGPFGAVVVDEAGALLAVGVNSVVVRSDPTAHAEVVAIRRAAARRHAYSLRGCTLVVTCAPCIMCAGAIHWAGIARVVTAARTTDAEALGFVEGPPGFDAAAFLRARGIDYEPDVERDAAVALLRSYRVCRAHPYQRRAHKITPAFEASSSQNHFSFGSPPDGNSGEPSEAIEPKIAAH